MLTELSMPEIAHILAIADPAEFLRSTCLRDIEAHHQVKRDSPFAAARAKASERKGNMLRRARGGLTQAEAAKRLHKTRQYVNYRVKLGEILAVEFDGRLRIPAFQVQGGELLPGLAMILAELENMGPWMKLAFFIDPNEMLEGHAPAEILDQQGEDAVGRIKETARVYSHST
jgi:hypothetical protein